MENAEIQMERLAAVPAANPWALVSIQALHPFYKGRSQEIVASWMTRQDRDTAIADNIAYVTAALRTAAPESGLPLVFAGFSQGVAMSYRAALRGDRFADGVIAVGGDVPPELVADNTSRFPPVTIVRGRTDAAYSDAALRADVEALAARGVAPEVHVVTGGHEWTPEVGAIAAAFLDRRAATAHGGGGGIVI